MKGFKDTGNGPRSGFHFPQSFGFSGSTGTVSNVRAHVRRYAKGGAVKSQMTTEHPGTPGHATVQRTKPSTALDQEAGGRTPLRPGFARGGKAGGGPISENEDRARRNFLTHERNRDAFRRAKTPKERAEIQQTHDMAFGAPNHTLSLGRSRTRRVAKADGGKVVRKQLPDGTPSFRRKQSLLDDLKESVRSAAKLASPSALKHRARTIDARTNFAAGGYAGGGNASGPKAVAEQVLRRHVRAAPPKGHGVKAD